MSTTDHQPPGLLLSRDLIFTNKITATAAQLGYLILVADKPSQVKPLVEHLQPRVVIIDLSAARWPLQQRLGRIGRLLDQTFVF